MLHIAGLQLREGLLDAKFLFLTTIILIAFFVNGIVYTNLYHLGLEDFQEANESNDRDTEEAAIGPPYFQGIYQRLYGESESVPRLQFLAVYEQRMTAPPAPLAFLADGGNRYLPNVVRVNAFGRFETLREQRENEELPIFLPLDWSFIIGALMSLLAVLLSFNSIAGEKSNATLRLLLSNPLSRLKLFTGKYLGLLAVMLIALTLGVLVNLLTIVFSGGPSLTIEIIESLGWAFCLSVACVSAFLLIGMAVSSMTHNPPVALVVLLVIWIFFVVVVPGLGRLVAEQLTEVPSNESVEKEQERIKKEIWEDAPPVAGVWSSRNPNAMNLPIRADVHRKVTSEQQRIRDEAIDAKLNQATLVKTLSSVSPTGLLADSLQNLSGTGAHGFRQLWRNADRYRKTLHDFVVERDETDPKSLHFIYPNRIYGDRGAYSLQGVPMNVVPHPEDVWTEDGSAGEQPKPLGQLLILIAYNLAAGIIAFIALRRYDPR